MTLALTLAGSLAAGGCAGRQSAAASPGDAASPSVDRDEHGLYTTDGQPGSLDAYIERVASDDTDFIAFGEHHYHPVGNRHELALLTGLAAQPRPIALALEFFEADHQAALDGYLAGAIDEATFRERTGRKDHYDRAHRPLVEFCKERGIPVIAANAPRRLVTGYRKSGKTYPDYLAGLTDEERGYMPASTALPEGEFKTRFMDLMGPTRGPAFFKSMVLWNDAMAESAANYRAAHEDHRVLLIVGAFHVAADLGTMESYRARRPDDTTSVVIMRQADDDEALRFEPDDRGEGDLILKVRNPPPAKTSPKS